MNGKNCSASGVDEAIITISENIDRNICSLNDQPGFMSQNILAQLRNLVDAAVAKISDSWVGYDYQSVRSKPWAEIPSEAQFLKDFYNKLKTSTSHYTLNLEISERLLAGFIEPLYLLRKYASRAWGLSILHHLEEIPDYSEEMSTFYSQIAAILNDGDQLALAPKRLALVYLDLCIPRLVDGQLFYELTVSDFADQSTKVDRRTIYSKYKISVPYAVKLTIQELEVLIGGIAVPVTVVSLWEYAIRPCEINGIASILGVEGAISINDGAYQSLMALLSEINKSLCDFVLLDQLTFDNNLKRIVGTNCQFVWSLLCRAREVIQGNVAGSNVIRYLLAMMRNRVIRNQCVAIPNPKLSGLYLRNGCIPFDRMPLCMALLKHVPSFELLQGSIEFDCRSDELVEVELKRRLYKDRKLFTPVEELNKFGDASKLIHEYNSKLFPKHRRDCEIVVIKIDETEYAFLKGYVLNVLQIENTLLSLTERRCELGSGLVRSYSRLFDKWKLSDDKKRIVGSMFHDSSVCLIQGEAGCGKTYTLTFIIDLFSSLRVLVLAHTNAAVENLRSKNNHAQVEFSTIRKAVSNSNSVSTYDVVIIDECGFVSNRDMAQLLRALEGKYQGLILAGDEHQLDAIQFGNWFELAQHWLSKSSVFHLNGTRRTDNSVLKKFWASVREAGAKPKNSEGSVSVVTLKEYIDKNGLTSDLDESIFDFDENGIVLCPSYNGPYGINSINWVFQSRFGGSPVIWGLKRYCIGDPVLFFEAKRFKGLIFNNEKGRIENVESNDERILFDVALEYPVTEEMIDRDKADMRFVGFNDNGQTVVRFAVFRRQVADGIIDRNEDRYVVPFQVAYAVSIHKAQGLQYDNVKLVVSDYDKGALTPNLFYTAITRAKKGLRIYWPSTIEGDFLSCLAFRNFDFKEYHLLKEIDAHHLNAL